MENKPYIVIARKYRPSNFDEVIGQEAIGTTLKNAIELNRIGHAYLFTGPRGVGKTSMARIFAKALNCKNGPTVNPCGKCQACIEIEGARALDVLEIDGASNRGIDEIRALRENVKFAPAAGKYKVYIIDEVHQITTDGFNALLKTLEEPPLHVKFIFATTSVQKIPATILSRCQRFDFKRISTDTIAKTLKDIAKSEKIKIDDEALFILAKTADGSLRDSQSLLDQIASSSEGMITKEAVLKSLGVLEEEKLVAIMQALLKHDAKEALLILDKVLEEGKEPSLFLEKLLEHVKNLLFLKVSDSMMELLDVTESYKKSLAAQAKELSKETLFYYFQVITHTLAMIKRFDSKRIPLEIALIKLAQDTPVENLSDLLSQIKSLEKKTLNSVNSRVFAVERQERPAPKEAPVPSKPAPVNDAALDDDKDSEILGEVELPMNEVVNGRSSETSQDLDAIWEPLLRLLKSEKISVASYLAEGEPTHFERGIAKIAFPETQSFHREYLESTENKKLIEKHLSSLMDQAVRVEFLTVKALSGKGFQGSDSKKASQTASVNTAAQSEAVKSAMNIFGGKIVR